MQVKPRDLIRIGKSHVSVADVVSENEELRRSNADLRDVVDFAAGLSARARDSMQVVAYARRTLQGLTGARVEVIVGEAPQDWSTPLVSAGRVVGGLRVEGGDDERWTRLRGAIVPQLASALASSTLAEESTKTHLESIASLSRLVQNKDNYSGPRAERVSNIAVGLAKRLGFTGPDLDAIEIGALIHDVGKIGIPESILNKPGPLDNDEWIIMKRHPVISDLILAESDLSPIITQIARSSHERMDGQGYPDGLVSEAIPLPARIVLVADAFEALTADRPYRRARRPKAAFEEIVANSGDQFCPKVVEALKQMYFEEPATLGEVQLTVVATA